MKLFQARTIAESLLVQMEPFCERIQIAGSIRRQCADVGDIEIVAIPKWIERPSIGNLFKTEMERVNLLHEWALTRARVQWIKTGTDDVIPWTPKADGRYWRGVLPATGMKLDVFLTEPARWGATLLVRTGSREFNKAMAAHATAVGKCFDRGALWQASTQLETREERDVFDLLGLQYIAPPHRTGAHAVRKLRAKMARLSVDLPHPRRPDTCQACGAEGAIHGNSGCVGEYGVGEVDAGVLQLIRWHEHDERDNPQRIVVVLCKRCADRIIKPHPRLYAALQPFAPWPGAMPVCVSCRHRAGLDCKHPDLKANGGGGLVMKFPQPQQVHLNIRGGGGGWRNFWRGPVTCEGREPIEATDAAPVIYEAGAVPVAVWNGDNDSPGVVRQARKDDN